MIAALAAVAVMGSVQTLDFVPTDDVWVYPHASSPESDPFLRAWGVDGQAVAKHPEDVDSFSYSYVRFDLKGLPKDAKITEAKLVLTNIANPGYTIDAAKKAPLEARPLKADFTEKGWNRSLARTLFPSADPKALFGTGAPQAIEEGKALKFEIDLLKGPADFRKHVQEAQGASGLLGVALTSTIDPSANGQSVVYKVYSRNAELAENRPVLRIKVE